jgi:4-hydroxybenzoate polyprenyltransferase/phosphoserine phosphatase
LDQPPPILLANVGDDPVSTRLPLAVDLDGTLLRGDLLLEAAVALIRRNPLNALYLLRWSLRGRAALKAWVAKAIAFEFASFPVNPGLMEVLRHRRTNGLPNVLVTAADQAHAESVAKHFGLFDAVLASDGRTNLRGETKARALSARFPNGFAYAGNAMADLPVWRSATQILAVNASARVVGKARAIGKPMSIIDPAPAIMNVAWRSMRPRHWAKNALVFVPALTSHRYLEIETLLACLVAALGLSLVASATYLVNDVLDIEHDRLHALKRFRPTAAGDLSVLKTLALATLLCATGLALGFAQHWHTGLLLVAYLGTTLAYALIFKAIPIVDIVVLAGLYVMRIVVGIVAIGSAFSTWLLCFAAALFLSLAVAKRYTEVVRYGVDRAPLAGRGYTAQDGLLLLAIGVSAAWAALMLLALYLVEDAVPAALYARPEWLWVILPLLFVWLGRVWLIAVRGDLHDDPVDFALRDNASLMLGAGVAIAFFAAA